MKFLTSLGNVSESKNFAKDLFKKSSVYKRFSIRKEEIEDKVKQKIQINNLNFLKNWVKQKIQINNLNFLKN
jgi:hypothetical protein